MLPHLDTSSSSFRISSPDWDTGVPDMSWARTFRVPGNTDTFDIHPTMSDRRPSVDRQQKNNVDLWLAETERRSNAADPRIRSLQKIQNSTNFLSWIQHMTTLHNPHIGYILNWRYFVENAPPPRVAPARGYARREFLGNNVVSIPR